MRDRPWWDAAYRLIDDERAVETVAFMCRELEISPSGYYRWRKRGPSARDLLDAKLCKAIQRIFNESLGTYGRRRICSELVEEGYDVSESRVDKLMTSMGMVATVPKKKWVTTKPGQGHLKIKDHVKRAFAPPNLDHVWVADATYLHTSDGILYLAVVMDSASRRILGWAMSVNQSAELMCNALHSALMRRPNRKAPVIHHSDRGSQYTSDRFLKYCKDNNVIPSVGRTGVCYDNAQIESWFASLKKECVSRLDNPDRETMEHTVFRWIAWYNQRRKHSKLGYASPIAFEERVRAANRD